MAAGDWTHVVDRYQKMRPEREKHGAQFLSGERPYLIYQSYPGNIWKDIRTPEASFLGSMAIVEGSLDVPSDDLPVLEPWFGTGVYASMYGCDYVWREGEAPAVHYRYHRVEEIRDIQTPDWRESEIAQLVLRAIHYFRGRTGDAIPIVLTDTQSASDSATLILDASETLVSCLAEPETMMNFMRGINRLILEFSEAQREAIGGAFIQPGHIMLCNKGFSGISLSDDNLAVVSPAVAKEFNLPLDDEIGRAWGGVAIHSCGKWAHMMRYLKDYCPSCVCVDGQ
jgi:uroporphyrinogen-III decarboxylase